MLPGTSSSAVQQTLTHCTYICTHLNTIYWTHTHVRTHAHTHQLGRGHWHEHGVYGHILHVWALQRAMHVGYVLWKRIVFYIGKNSPRTTFAFLFIYSHTCLPRKQVWQECEALSYTTILCIDISENWYEKCQHRLPYWNSTYCGCGKLYIVRFS